MPGMQMLQSQQVLQQPMQQQGQQQQQQQQQQLIQQQPQQLEVLMPQLQGRQKLVQIAPGITAVQTTHVPGAAQAMPAGAQPHFMQGPRPRAGMPGMPAKQRPQLLQRQAQPGYAPAPGGNFVQVQQGYVQAQQSFIPMQQAGPAGYGQGYDQEPQLVRVAAPPGTVILNQEPMQPSFQPAQQLVQAPQQQIVTAEASQQLYQLQQGADGSSYLVQQPAVAQPAGPAPVMYVQQLAADGTEVLVPVQALPVAQQPAQQAQPVYQTLMPANYAGPGKTAILRPAVARGPQVMFRYARAGIGLVAA
jgi:hypothetical protein